MSRGPENIFGKAPGRYDEMMARRLATSLPDQALVACAAMDDEAFILFAMRLSDLFSKGARIAHIKVAAVGGYALDRVKGEGGGDAP